MPEARDFRDLLARLGERRPLRLRYDGHDTPVNLTAWQREFRDKLIELSGPVDPIDFVEGDQARPAPPVEHVETVELADHVRDKVRIGSPSGFAVPAYVLRPTTASPDRRPAVLALHGHTEHGKDSVAGVAAGTMASHPADYGRAAVRAGFVVLCPDFLGWGERREAGFDFAAQDICNLKFMAGMMYGLPLLSLMVHDARAALDALLARDDVDPRRVGAMGNSFGGRMTMWLAAFDERVRFAASSGALNCFSERSLKMGSCGAQFLPGQLQWGDVEDVYGLIAPRPLLIAAGRADPLLPGEHVERMVPVIERAWRAAGAPECLTVHRHDGGHFLPQGPVVRWLVEQAGLVEAAP